MQKKDSGFSLVEIVIAASIISFSLVSMVSIASSSIAYSRRSVNTYSATTLAEEGIEAVRILRGGSWSSISGLTLDTPYYLTFTTPADAWSLGLTKKIDGAFTRVITVSAVRRLNGIIVTDGTGVDDPGTRLVNVDVSWVEGGATVHKSVSAYFSNIL